MSEDRIDLMTNSSFREILERLNFGLRAKKLVAFLVDHLDKQPESMKESERDQILIELNTLTLEHFGTRKATVYEKAYYQLRERFSLEDIYHDPIDIELVRIVDRFDLELDE